MSRRAYPPDYVSKETLAHRLDLTAGAIDQYVRRGVLPDPVQIGDALRWRWADVEARLSNATAASQDDDPYMRGLNGSGQAAAARSGRPS